MRVKTINSYSSHWKRTPVLFKDGKGKYIKRMTLAESDFASNSNPIDDPDLEQHNQKQAIEDVTPKKFWRPNRKH